MNGAMNEVRRFVQYTVPGTLFVVWLMIVTSLPALIGGLGRTSTPVPGLSEITGAEVALIAVFAMALGVVLDAVAHYLPSVVLPSGIVRWDMPGEVLRRPDLLGRAQQQRPGYPNQDLLTASIGPLRRSHPDPSRAFLRVCRLDGFSGLAWVPLDVRRAWMQQVALNSGLLKDVLGSLVSEPGRALNAKYLNLTDRYRSMGTCRIGVAIAGLIGEASDLTHPHHLSFVRSFAVASVAAILTIVGVMVFSQQRVYLLRARKRVVEDRFSVALRAEPHPLDEPETPDAPSS